MKLCVLVLAALILSSQCAAQDSLSREQKPIYRVPSIDTIIVTKLRFFDADTTDALPDSTASVTKTKVRVSRKLYTAFSYPKPPRRVVMEGSASILFRFDAKGNIDKRHDLSASHDFFAEALHMGIWKERFFTFKSKKNSGKKLWGKIEVEWRLKKK